jgi:hypothetical protein
MSTQTIKVMVPPTVAQPRAAVWPTQLLEALSSLGGGIWRALESMGQRRARNELLRLAEVHAGRPEFAQQLRDAAHRAIRRAD